MQPNRPDQLGVGVTYWPADVGPYLWHEFHPATVIRDLTAIASRRIPVVRVMLSWDVFMPSDRAPNGRRMRDLETLLNAARDVGIRVVITLFAQSLGDCVMLPAYAIDRRGPRAGGGGLADPRAGAARARGVPPAHPPQQRASGRAASRRWRRGRRCSRNGCTPRRSNAGSPSVRTTWSAAAASASRPLRSTSMFWDWPSAHSD